MSRLKDHFKITNHVIRTRHVVRRVRSEVTEVLFFERVSEVKLLKRKSYYIVLLENDDGYPLYRLYVPTRGVAETFIDALSVLKRAGR